MCLCVLLGGAGGGSGYSLSHVSVYSGVLRQLLSGECPHISAFSLAPCPVLCFHFNAVTSASLCTSGSEENLVSFYFVLFYYSLAAQKLSSELSTSSVTDSIENKTRVKSLLCIGNY